MKINRGRTYVMSELTVDADIDMNSFGFTELGNCTLVKNSGIQMLAALVADGDWCGHTTQAIAGESLSVGSVVYLASNGKVLKANSESNVRMLAKGMSTTDALINDLVVILLDGFMRVNIWDWTVGNVLYVRAISGEMIAIPREHSGDIIQRVAIAVTADIVNFRPSKDVLEVT